MLVLLLFPKLDKKKREDERERDNHKKRLQRERERSRQVRENEAGALAPPSAGSLPACISPIFFFFCFSLLPHAGENDACGAGNGRRLFGGRQQRFGGINVRACGSNGGAFGATAQGRGGPTSAASSRAPAACSGTPAACARAHACAAVHLWPRRAAQLHSGLWKEGAEEDGDQRPQRSQCVVQDGDWAMGWRSGLEDGRVVVAYLSRRLSDMNDVTESSVVFYL